MNDADLGVIGFLSADQGDSGGDDGPLHGSPLPGAGRSPDRWYASLLRLSGRVSRFRQCRAALDDGLFRLERQGWRQPVIRVAPWSVRKPFASASCQSVGDADRPARCAVAAGGSTKVSPLTGELRGAEVLLRWRHRRLVISLLEHPSSRSWVWRHASTIGDVSQSGLAGSPPSCRSSRIWPSTSIWPPFRVAFKIG
ncbi:hypothetical protein DSL92_07860 [Billgrantia gudaonensis]|uniref:Uncharacterized protein n=1 Tax=Billgrantia gudaonensis TaxID=376427 RepID=A0A432JGH0_9GAMM|nr:hypothetical protein DSL92_07860 [Halomonas gudaonensis]